MDNYAMSQRKNPLTSVRGIIFMVAGAVFLLPYLVVSVPVLITFFISLYQVFANLFTFSGQGLSMAFACLTPLLSSVTDLLQCFVGPVSLVLCFLLIAFRNEEKASVFGVLNLISTLVTLFAGKVSMQTPAWALNLLADLVLAFTLLAFALCEGKLRNSQRWIWLAAVSCVIRIGGMLVGMNNNIFVHSMEYYPVADYEGFVASFRQFVTAVLSKKEIPADVKITNAAYTFSFSGLADNWAAYISAANAVDTAPLNTLGYFDFPRGIAKSMDTAINGKAEIVNLLYIVSTCVMSLFGFLMMFSFKKKEK